MTGRWGEMPFVVLTLCLAAGIAASRPLIQYSFLGLVLATACAIGAGLLSLYRDRLACARILALGATFLCGLVFGITKRDGFPSHDVRSLLATNALPLGVLVPFDGCIVEETEHKGGDIIVTLELHGFRTKEQWVPCRGRALLRMPDSLPEEGSIPGPELRYGDRVRGYAYWNAPRNFKNPGSLDSVGSLARRGIYLLGRVKSSRVLEILHGDCDTAWKRAAIFIRDRLREGFRGLRQQGSGREAAVLASLLIGDYSELQPATREDFQNSGTYHVLVVSGLHVAWIAGTLMLVLRALRFPADIGRLLVACGIFFYACLVGFQASISRSLWMLLLVFLGQSLYRKSNPVNLVMAAGFALLAARPDWLLEIGFQLSFLSVLAIFVLGMPLAESWIRPLFEPLRHAGDPERLLLEPGMLQRRGRRWRAQAEILAEACADRWGLLTERVLIQLFRPVAGAAIYLGGMALVSFSVQIWLEPLLAYYFNRLSWIAPLANLVIVPLSSFVLAAAALAGIASNTITRPDVAFGIAGSLCSFFLKATEWFSGLPGAWQRCPTPSALWVSGGLLLIFAWCIFGWRRLWIPWFAIGVHLLSIGFGSDALGWFPGRDTRTWGISDRAQGATPMLLRLTFLDVGQGDSIVIRFPDARVWVLDAGGIRDRTLQDDDTSTFDIGEFVVSRYLWFLGIRRLDRIILSHPHQDHAGGIPALMRNFSVAGLQYGERRPEANLLQLLAVARERRVACRPVCAGESQQLAGVDVEILNPPVDGTNRSINDSSVVLRLRMGRFSALLAGDLEKPGEIELLSRARDLSSLLLKVAHHGSRTATLDPFLEQTRPRWAVLSAGRNNPFGHPSREVLLRLVRHGARPLLTVDQGAISFQTDGINYILESHVSGLLERGSL